MRVPKKVVEQEVQQMLVEANGNFQDMIENLMIEAGHSDDDESSGDAGGK